MKWNQPFSPLEINPDEPLPELIITHLSSWSAIVVTGADQKTYLQGQLTCDVKTLSREQSELGAHCDPKGKMWSIFRLFHHGEGLALFQHADALGTALAELKKYSVFSKVDIVSTENIALGVLGKHADSLINSLSDIEADVRPISGGTAVKIEDNRWLLLIDENSASQLINAADNATFADEAIWDCFDIQAGIPRITSASQNEYIPQAFNLQLLDGICFTKGCYTGQETVARARYRGANKRAMFKVSGNCTKSLDAQSELERRVGENWRSAGRLLAHYQYKNGHCIGLIILPNDLDPETELRLKEASDSFWKIDVQPYSLVENENPDN